MGRFYPKHKFALEVVVKGYVFATLYNELWVAKKIFEAINPDGDVSELRLHHNHQVIMRKRIDYLDRSHK
jgi:hypothetical protein